MSACTRKGVLPQSVTLFVGTGFHARVLVLFRQLQSLLVRTPRGGPRSGSELQKEAVECHPQAAEEKQRREVLRYEGKDRCWQRDLNGIAVPAGKIVNHASEERSEEHTSELQSQS